MIKSALLCILGLSLLGLIAQDGFARRVAYRFQPRPPRSQVTGEGLSATGPTVSSLPPVIYVGDNFLIQGSGFTPGSAVNFFVATASGAINFGPIIPTNILPTSMLAFVPVSVSQGEGVVSVQVVNTDQGHVSSNAPLTLLQGDASAGLPSLTGVDGVGLAASSVETGIGVANVETIVTPGETASLTGDGFDVTNGVGVDLFCVCPGQKVGPFFLLPGNPGLGATSLSFTLPSGLQAPGTGPGSFQVTNLGNGSKSAGVSVPIGARMSVTAVSQSGSAVAVDGTGFSSLTVINLFNLQGTAVANLGGLNSDATPKIPLSLANDHHLSFTLPGGIVPGPAYIQALNPPFIPFTSSGNDPGGAFIAM